MSFSECFVCGMMFRRRCSEQRRQWEYLCNCPAPIVVTDEEIQKLDPVLGRRPLVEVGEYDRRKKGARHA